MISSPRLLAVSIAVVAVVLLSGCTTQTDASNASDTSSVAGAPAGTELPTDRAFLTADLWNDGRAEVAFYRVERSRDQYGRAADQSFVVGTYLVKHRFSRDAMTKVTDESGVSAFKYALFYELESGSYQYKRNWVVNARQEDLAPLKESFTSFDWCSNRFHEFTYASDGRVGYEMRSDDYGNAERTLDVGDARADAVPSSLVPLLVRSLDLTERERAFHVVRADGDPVAATARLDGTETVSTPGGAIPTERVVVTYDAPVASPVGEETGTTETYWRASDGDRRLVKLSGDDGRYEMTLVEHLRTAYWNENLWPRLERIDARP